MNGEINTVYHLLGKSNQGRGEGLIYFLPLRRGFLSEGGDLSSFDLAGHGNLKKVKLEKL